MDIVELIVAEIQKKREMLARLFTSPGQIIINIDPRSKSIKLTVKIRL